MVEAPAARGPEKRGEYLLEVRAEEIPARMLEPAVRELATRLFEELMARNLPPREVETAFTPRRLVLVCRGLPAREPDIEERVVGPPVSKAYKADGSPSPALAGFARRCGVAPEELVRVATDKGEYVAAIQQRRGAATGEVLAELVPRILAALSWPKTMVWGQGEGPWVRPIHGIVSLLDGEVVPFELFGVAAGATTAGHPLLSPEPFAVAGADDHRLQLATRGIEVRPEERRRRLAEQMAAAAAELGGRPVSDPALLDKLVALCEVPGLVRGSFDPGFLELPREVLATSLRDHQSAFAVEADGQLLPQFLTVMDRPDDPAGRVRAGNEWVVAARLADARFFYQEDRKRSLEDRTEDLRRLTFHLRLGSYADKAERLVELARVLAEELGWGDEEVLLAARAAHLLKADLATEMVKEFTSLQGVVGGLYARQEGYPEEVWQAIYDQYLPAGADDPVPRGRVGKVTALADRMDTLVGMFGLGLVPSGSRDPFGLRRAAQAAVRIAFEGELPFDLDLVAVKAARLYGDRLPTNGEEILPALRPFLDDRVRYVLGSAGYAHDEIEAALAVGAQDLPNLGARVAALHRVREEKEFLSLVLSAKRIVNIVRDAPEHALDEPLLVEPAEKDLHAAWRAAKEEVEEAAAAGDYERCLRRTSELAAPLDRFFVEVLVMAEDEALRRNRIALLQAIHRVISRTARLTEVVVDRAEHRARHGE
jgi:glycyl-tRNA synthetase beta chain